jgi:peptidoglycan/LPS O-acetylase OafA/YrhL
MALRAHVYPLDAIRFFAALSVMLFHLSFYGWASVDSVVGHMFNHATDYPQATPFTSWGWVGVEIFFVISGFVIANSANNATPIAFAKSRVLRLYPAVWICAFFTLAAWLAVGTETTRHLDGELLRSLTLWIFGPWLDGVYWSLAVELVFYAIIFALLLSGRFDKLTWAAWALLMASGVFLVALMFRPGWFNSPLGWQIVLHADVLQIRYGSFFALGIWMWLFTMKAIKRTDWIGVALAVVVGVIEIVQRAHEMAATEVRQGIPISDIVPELVWLAAVAFMFLVARTPERFAPMSRAGQEAFKHLGQMTYPLYLTHAVGGAFLIRTMVGAGVTPWAALAIAVCAMLTLAYGVARIGEPALRKALRALWERAEKSVKGARALAFLFKPGGAAA